jgi:serine/threonine protein kinase
MEDPIGLVGSTLGEVTIERFITWGGFGVLYQGRQTSIGRHCAVKVLYPQQEIKDDNAWERVCKAFNREMILLGNMQARAKEGSTTLRVPEIYTSGVYVEGKRPLPWLAMEWLHGTTLEDQIEQRVNQAKDPLGGQRAWYSPQECIDVLATALEACEVAHRGAQVVIHRDIKPANIFVRMPRVDESVVAARPTSRSKTYLLDFGIAVVREGQRGPMSVATHVHQRHPSSKPHVAALCGAGASRTDCPEGVRRKQRIRPTGDHAGNRRTCVRSHHC